MARAVRTSRSNEKHRRRARELDADGYIAKPFTRDQLCREVTRVSAGRLGTPG